MGSGIGQSHIKDTKDGEIAATWSHLSALLLLLTERYYDTSYLVVSCFSSKHANNKYYTYVLRIAKACIAPHRIGGPYPGGPLNDSLDSMLGVSAYMYY